jgi:hypothetical protein
MLFDSGSDDPKRILIFASPAAQELLKVGKHFLMDGTFKVVDKNFYQMVVIHVWSDAQYISLVYAILPSKEQEIYSKMFRAILDEVPTFSPETMTTDFESGFINVTQNFFPEAKVCLCLFHLCQSVRRKVCNDMGLKKRYESINDDFAVNVRMLPALAFVPPEKVIEYFMEIEEYLSNEPEYEPLLSYFEEVYIGRRRGRGSRVRPRFSIESWNVHQRVLDGLHRTNNASEGFNSAINNSLGCSHPSLWKLIRQFKNEESNARSRMTSAIIGERPTKKVKYIATDQRILVIVTNRVNDEKLKYLRSIGYNLKV